MQARNGKGAGAEEGTRPRPKRPRSRKTAQNKKNKKDEKPSNTRYLLLAAVVLIYLYDPARLPPFLRDILASVLGAK